MHRFEYYLFSQIEGTEIEDDLKEIHDDGADQDYHDDDPHTTDMEGRPGYEIPPSAQKIKMML